MSITSDPSDGTEIVARSARRPRALLALTIVNGTNFAFWAWRIGTEEQGRGRLVVLAVSAVVFLAVVGGFVLVFRRRGGTSLVLTDTELRLVRRLNPVVIRRQEVLAVRGNIPGRPSWSEHVLVQTQGGLHTLPPLNRPASELIPALQQWSGASEDAKSRHEPPPSESVPPLQSPGPMTWPRL